MICVWERDLRLQISPGGWFLRKSFLYCLWVTSQLCEEGGVDFPSFFHWIQSCLLCVEDHIVTQKAVVFNRKPCSQKYMECECVDWGWDKKINFWISSVKSKRKLQVTCWSTKYLEKMMLPIHRKLLFVSPCLDGWDVCRLLCIYFSLRKITGI